jgi:hydrogenase expression/formation protein HypE
MELIQLAHGSGGRMMHQLIREFFVPAFDLKELGDSAVLENTFSGRIAITTDSYVVSPLFFPGGDIGRLSVCGTVNDLAVSGATPVYMTAGFIIEEGFPFDHLKRVLGSMRAASKEAGIQIVAGDTKVVDRGKADGIFINTAGFGVVGEGLDLSPMKVKPGDRVLLSGSIGNHGVAVMAERNGISFEPPLLSDVGPLNGLVKRMADKTKKIRMMRDPTRGGIATTLKEIASESGCCIVVHESAIEVKPGVKGACELLGLDPLYIANEGVLIAIVDPEVADALADEMRKTAEGAGTAVIGEVVETPRETVLLKTNVGGIRIVDMLSGDQLPRIC